MKTIPSYYLFGSELITEYEQNNNPENTAKLIRDNWGKVIEFNADTHPSEVLSAYNGWLDWIEISESEYKSIKEKI